MISSRIANIFLPLVIMVFSLGFTFSEVGSGLRATEKVEADYLRLVTALSLSEDDLSDEIFDNYAYQDRYSILSTQMLSLAGNAQSLKDRYTANKYKVESEKKKSASLKEIPKAKKKLAVGQSSKKAIKKVKLKLTKKQKIALKKKKSKKRIAKKEKGSKYIIAKGSWHPSASRLKKVYGRALSSKKIPKSALKSAFKYYEKNKHRKRLGSKYIVVADYTNNSKRRRLHVISLSTGKVKSYQVAHGRRSGPVGGKVHSTSNRRGSNKTSKGFFKVGFKEGRTITKGYRYLSVTGLERGNRKVGLPSRMGGRDVVIHTARYVASGGRSNGCFAIKPSDRRAIFSRIKGSLLYSYAGRV